MSGPTGHRGPARATERASRPARRAGAVAALGLAGVAALLLQPLPPAIADAMAATAGTSVLALRALAASMPALLVLVAALVGAALAHRVGLRSVVAGTACARRWARDLGASAVAGGALGLVLAGIDALLHPWLGEDWARLVAANPSDGAALVLGLLYGGLAEEVMLRWGLMSLVAWGLVAVSGARRTAGAMSVAIALAALLFAAAHLPALSARIELTTPVLIRTLLLNAAAGAVYGWLFWRRHLEAAMAAHAGTHLGLWAWRALAA